VPETDQTIDARVLGSRPVRAEDSAPHEPVEILAVDDNAGNLLALETALAPLGEKVVCASSGREALRQLLSRDFATVILDINMPDLDGFETARMIRSRARSSATPIIFVSAVSIDEADVRRGYSLGAVDYLCAPFVPEVLRAKVAVFVELHRKSEEARRQAERLRQRTRELEQSQRELRLSERMASLGTLCVGIGHDMGNLLLPISVWIDSDRLDELPPDLREGVQNLRACVQYLRRLASGLRLVSLDPSEEIGDSRVLPGEWVREVAPVLRTALPRGVSLEIDVPGDLPAVRIASHRLAQAVFNLVQNAGEALHELKNGVVRLSARLDRENGLVRIAVSDNGPGMPREVLARCLDPFFTTKTRGISTGLGLSLVHGVVHAAGGTLDVSSAPGEGTTFHFSLALVDDAPPVRAAALVTVADPRTQALAVALAGAAGCEVVSAAPSEAAGPVAWITDAIDGLEERAGAFLSESPGRHVFIITNEAVDLAGVTATPLTGSRGLAAQLRRFLSEPAGAVGAR
jgi:signal transduction histidine kinase